MQMSAGLEFPSLAQNASKTLQAVFKGPGLVKKITFTATDNTFTFTLRTKSGAAFDGVALSGDQVGTTFGNRFIFEDGIYVDAGDPLIVKVTNLDSSANVVTMHFYATPLE